MIIRGPRPEGNFYILDKRISEDSRLTWAARGLLIYLLGKPDHWEVSTQAMINETAATRSQTGRDGVRSIVNELIIAGYVTRIPTRDAGGKLSGFDYSVCETSSPPGPAQPATAQPATAQPATANPLLVSIESLARTEEEARIDKNKQPMPAAPLGVVQADGGVKPKKPSVESNFVLPDWIDVEVWTAFIAMRKVKGVKSSDYALNLVVKSLQKFSAAGHDPDTVLNNSILNNWTGVFEPKTHTPSTTFQNRQTRQSEWMAAIQNTGENHHAASNDHIIDIHARFAG